MVWQTNSAHCDREGAVITEKGERQTSTQESTWGKSLKQLAWKVRGAEFCEFLQTARFKAWRFKSGGLAEIQPGGHHTTLGEKAGKGPTDIQCWKGDLKSAWGTQWEGYSFISECVPERQHSWRDPSGN